VRQFAQRTGARLGLTQPGSGQGLAVWVRWPVKASGL
jgi:hypothetical protein